MAYIKIEDLKEFCAKALELEGMRANDARVVADVLVETDAYGTHSHGTKNLHNYIRKYRVGGMDILGEPQVLTEGPSYAVVDAKNTLGMIPSVKAVSYTHLPYGDGPDALRWLCLNQQASTQRPL